MSAVGSAEWVTAALSGVAGLVTLEWVDGIPVLLAPDEGPDDDGTIHAGIVFGVGAADETLVTSGVSHLVEHLALYRQSTGEPHRNGETTLAHTHFHVVGDEREVVDHLNSVCASLRDLPLERLAAEVQILRTESDSSPTAVPSLNAFERFGAHGPGLAWYDEIGVNALTPEIVAEWARTRFTRGNAVVWMTAAALPEGLALTLPDGGRRSLPAWPAVLPTTPAWCRGPSGRINVDAYLPRSSAALVFSRLAARLAFRALRTEGGYSYVADAAYEPLDAERVRIGVYADALPEQEAAAVGALVDVLAGLRAGRIAPDDLQAAKDALRPRVGKAGTAALLPHWAMILVEGGRPESLETLEAERNAVTTADVTAVARAFWDEAIAQIPTGTLDWAGFAAAPTRSPAAVSGARFAAIDDPDVELVIGQDGVSLALPDGALTVRYDALEAYATRPDGVRMLFGGDGFSVEVEPTLFAGLTPAALSEIDVRVPAGLHIALPARPSDRIPQPGPAPAAVPGFTGFGWWAAAVWVVGLVATIIFGLAALELSGSVGGEIDGESIDAVDAVLGWVLTAIGAGFTAFFWWARRRRRAVDALRAAAERSSATG